MPLLSFKEALTFIAEKFHSQLPEELLSSEEVEVKSDQLSIQIYKEKDGTIAFCTFLGFFEEKPNLSQLQELAHSNFLGIQTKGAVLSLDKHSHLLQLHFLCPKNNIQSQYLQNFEDFYSVASAWKEKLHTWPTFSLFAEVREVGI